MTLHIKLSDEAALEASLDRALQAAPLPIDPQGVWLFVYGALAADPPFRPAERREARLEGYRRSFNIADPLNRGSAASPGLVLGLEQGDACNGLAFRIKPNDLRPSLMAVWRQEMRLPAYEPLWVEARTKENSLTVLVFDTRREGPLHRPGLTDAETAAWIARATGSAGPNAAYLHETIEAFSKADIQDPYLTTIAGLL
jgi:cation transport protein ChaC